MTAYFPQSIRIANVGSHADRRSARRALRRAMKDRAMSILEGHGYVFRDRIELNTKARALTATRDGKPLNVGFRSGADRWMAVTRSSLDKGGELTIVNEIIVAVFANTKRDALEIWRFDAKVVAEMGEAVFAKSGSAGQQWLPLDDTRDMSVNSMAAGSLSKRGELVERESIIWTDEDNGVAANAPPASSPLDPNEAAPLTLAQAKAGLAKTFGVSPENVRISIEA